MSTGLDMSKFREGKVVDFVEFAESAPGYFSEELVETARRMRELPPFTLRVTSVVHPRERGFDFDAVHERQALCENNRHGRRARAAAKGRRR